MKNPLITGLVIGLSSALAQAGPVASTPPPVAVESLPPVCDCYDLGGSGIDLFGVYVSPDSGGLLDDSGGGGIGFTHFANSYLGFSTGVYWWDDGHDTVTSLNGNVILRYPIRSLCIAPYAIGGIGAQFDSLNDFTWQLGGGIELRIPALRQWGFFADATYNWADESEDYMVYRVGTRYHF